MFSLQTADSETAMGPPSLSNIPPEIQITVFQSLANLSDGASLARTSRTFNEIWRLNTASICDAMLPRIIDCLDDAANLIEAQAYSENLVEAPGQDRNLVAIQRAQRYLSNQNAAHHACDVFADDVISNFEGLIVDRLEVLSSTERPRFIQAYYQVWLFYIIAIDYGWEEFPQAFIATFTKSELLFMLGMLEWIQALFFWISVDPLILGKPWEGDYDKIGKLIKGIQTQVDYGGAYPYRSHEPPLWTILDDFQDNLEMILSRADEYRLLF